MRRLVLDMTPGLHTRVVHEGLPLPLLPLLWRTTWNPSGIMLVPQMKKVIFAIPPSQHFILLTTSAPHSRHTYMYIFIAKTRPCNHIPLLSDALEQEVTATHVITTTEHTKEDPNRYTKQLFTVVRFTGISYFELEILGVHMSASVWWEGGNFRW